MLKSNFRMVTLSCIRSMISHPLQSNCWLAKRHWYHTLPCGVPTLHVSPPYTRYTSVLQPVVLPLSCALMLCTVWWCSGCATRRRVSRWRKPGCCDSSRRCTPRSSADRARRCSFIPIARNRRCSSRPALQGKYYGSAIFCRVRRRFALDFWLTDGKVDRSQLSHSRSGEYSTR